MKLTTIIIEDTEKQYLRLREQLAVLPEITIVSTYLGERPFEGAILAINKHKPHLIILDWDLDDIEGRKGEQIIKYIEDYPYYIFFCSSYVLAINKTQALYSNAKFFLKEPGRQLLPPEELNQAIKIAQKYLEDQITILLSFYKDGKPGKGKDNISERNFLCKNILNITVKGKMYMTEYIEKDEIKIYSGYCDKSSDMMNLVNKVNYSNFYEATSNPYAMFNILYYDHMPDSHLYRVRPEYNSKLLKEIKVKYS